MDRKTRAIFREIMREIGRRGGKIGGKRSLETMTPEKRSAGGKNAAMAAPKARKAERLAKEQAARIHRKAMNCRRGGSPRPPSLLQARSKFPCAKTTWLEGRGQGTVSINCKSSSRKRQLGRVAVYLVNGAWSTLRLDHRACR